MDFNAKVLVSGELDNLLPSFDLELTELILPRDDFYFIRFRRNSRRFREKIHTTPSYSLSAKSKGSTCYRSWET